MRRSFNRNASYRLQSTTVMAVRVQTRCLCLPPLLFSLSLVRYFSAAAAAAPPLNDDCAADSCVVAILLRFFLFFLLLLQ